VSSKLPADVERDEPDRRTARSRIAARMRRAGARAWASAGPIGQCAAAAGAAWWVANDLVGHQRPFFAPIAAVISLGVSLGTRLRRTAELVLGVSLGVLVGDLIISWIGSGPWQVAVVVALAMLTAVFADGATLLVGQAGSSAVLVATLLPPGQSGGLDRCVDALIGGLIGLLVAAVLPTDPVGPVRRRARALLGELACVLQDVASALRARNADAALEALRRARATQPLVDELRTAVRAGREVTAVAPLRRRRRATVAMFAQVAERSDYAMRNVRVLARRVYVLLVDDDPAPGELADAMSELASVVERLTVELGRDGYPESVRDSLADIARHSLAPRNGSVGQDGSGGPVRAGGPVESVGTVGSAGPVGSDGSDDLELTDGPDGLSAPDGPSGPDGSDGSDGGWAVSELVAEAQLRSIVLDLLQATGLSRRDAMSAMRGG
jgi:uncharacterized membrane protein YgaE (UPF0421/DUF939 family)